MEQKIGTKLAVFFRIEMKSNVTIVGKKLNLYLDQIQCHQQITLV